MTNRMMLMTSLVCGMLSSPSGVVDMEKARELADEILEMCNASADHPLCVKTT